MLTKFGWLIIGHTKPTLVLYESSFLQVCLSVRLGLFLFCPQYPFLYSWENCYTSIRGKVKIGAVSPKLNLSAVSLFEYINVDCMIGTDAHFVRLIDTRNPCSPSCVCTVQCVCPSSASCSSRSYSLGHPRWVAEGLEQNEVMPALASDDSSIWHIVW
jgi:hypothetical protein